MMQMRTHTCGELRIGDVGKAVTLAGWLENMRVVSGSLAFVVLRDFYGTTQIVVENDEMMKTFRGITKESTIQVEGTVRERSSKNPNQETGDIEVVPSSVKVLGRCRYNELPFEINHSREADEQVRLKYRYLDLRNPAVKKNILLRCHVVEALRKAMTEHGFLEITTPILTASSPEGARDYLVPARKHPGKFYALPQAPQQFKQLLMTAAMRTREETVLRESSISSTWRWHLPVRRTYSPSLRMCCRRFSQSSEPGTELPARRSCAFLTARRWKSTARTSRICASISWRRT